MSDTTHADTHVVHAHISPLWQLAGILIALLLLTVATVAVSYANLGNLSILVALLIAAVKGTLVVLYFMHLRYDAPFNALVFSMALLFVALMIGFTLIDSRQYQPNLTPPPAVGNVPE
ncbi:MAG: cytochrome C oxidase subunit IV family protein [Phycisphaeraceae bacterium]|nr:cytochrome C oxidase subunit IV family protein [Phycisphaeraceae bacterium]